MYADNASVHSEGSEQFEIDVVCAKSLILIKYTVFM